MSESRAQRLLPADHPALPGHFPGHPIAPGVLLLDWVIEAILDTLRSESGDAWMLEALPAVKFLHVLRPGQALEISWRRVGVEFHFRAETAALPVLQGRLRVRQVASA